MTKPDFTNMTNEQYDEYARQRDVVKPMQMTDHQRWTAAYNELYHEHGCSEAECLARLGPEPPQKRLVAIDNQNGVTAVAAEFDEGLEMQREMDAVQDDAANRGGY